MGKDRWADSDGNLIGFIGRAFARTIDTLHDVDVSDGFGGTKKLPLKAPRSGCACNGRGFRGYIKDIDFCVPCRCIFKNTKDYDDIFSYRLTMNRNTKRTMKIGKPSNKATLAMKERVW